MLGGLLARRAAWPAHTVVEQRVLQVLGDQTSDERRSVRPLQQPPPPLAHCLLEHRDGRGIGEPTRGQVVQGRGTCREQWVVCHGVDPVTGLEGCHGR